MHEILGVQESNELILVVEGKLKIHSNPRIGEPGYLLLDQTTWEIGLLRDTVVYWEESIVLVVKTE